MAREISTMYIKGYNAVLQERHQQDGSKLEANVRVETQNSKQDFYDYIGNVSALTQPTNQTDDTVWVYTPHNRRSVSLVYYTHSEPIGTVDKVQTIADPTNPYARNAAKAFGRSKDDVILTAASGIALTGENGETSTSFDSNMIVTASGHAFSGDEATMNLDKVLGCMRLLDDNDVSGDDRIMVCNPRQKYDLLTTTEVASSDYNTVKALAQGKLHSFAGFDFVWTTRVIANASSQYPCYAYHKEALLLSIGIDALKGGAAVNQRPDKNNVWQIFNDMYIGATRMDEEAIVQVFCE